jgi:glycosyltransferase involved in cell wall biosynthesis
MRVYPKITVVIPSYNQGRYIEETLCSVLDQAYRNLELIVIDGGSTDDSVDVIGRYAKHINYWISEPDGGRTLGLIKGFHRATGTIACWLNAHDLHEPNTLRDVAEFFSAEPTARFVFGDFTRIGADGEVLYYRREIGFHRWLWLYAYNYIPQPASFWRHDLFTEVGGLDPGYRLASDADLFARFSRVTRLHHIGRPLARFRHCGEQSSQAYRLQSLAEQHDILCREVCRPVSQRERAVLGFLARAVRYSARVLPIPRFS